MKAVKTKPRQYEDLITRILSLPRAEAETIAKIYAARGQDNPPAARRNVASEIAIRLYAALAGDAPRENRP